MKGIKNSFVIGAGALATAINYASDIVLYNDSNVHLSENHGVKIETVCDINFNTAVIANKNMYLPFADFPEKKFDELIDLVLSNNVKLYIRCSETLHEVGVSDSRYNKSPIMLLHSFGLLENSVIIGAHHLDNDDLALMQQENASLVLTPSDSFSKGLSVPPMRAYINSGVKISLATGSGRFNRSHNIFREAYLIKMITCANMNSADAILDEELIDMIATSKTDFNEICKKIYE